MARATIRAAAVREKKPLKNFIFVGAALLLVIVGGLWVSYSVSIGSTTSLLLDLQQESPLTSSNNDAATATGGGGGGGDPVPSAIAPGSGSSVLAKEKNNQGSLRCRVGKSPWSDLTKQEWNQYAKEFIQIWKRSPDKDNPGGGGFFHYFGLFTTIRLLQPTAIVESGAWHGIGTWFLRQAAGSNVKIVVLSPHQPTKYVDKDGLYLTGSKFIDFGQTTYAQWQNSWVPDTATTLLFLDDHQAGLKRLKQAQKLGFKHIWIDDNYPPGPGDNFALKQVCSGMALWNFVGLSVPVFKDNFNAIEQPLTPQEYQEYEQSFRDNVAVYAEFPPAWRGPSRFPSMNETVIDQVSEPPLFTKDELRALGLEDSHLVSWDHEASGYTFVLYVQPK